MPSLTHQLTADWLRVLLRGVARSLRSACLWPSQNSTRLICINFATLLLLGTFLSGWLLRYTDYFEVFGGLLALGGLFTWLAFLLKLFPETEMQRLQAGLYELVLKQPWMWALYLGMLLLALLVTAT